MKKPNSEVTLFKMEIVIIPSSRWFEFPNPTSKNTCIWNIDWTMNSEDLQQINFSIDSTAFSKNVFPALY